MPLALGNIPDAIGKTPPMEIKITIQQDQKQAITRDFASASDAMDYLEGMVENDDIAVEESENEAAQEEGKVGQDFTAPAEAEPSGTDFTNEQRFEVGQRVVFYSVAPEDVYAGEHTIVEEREEAIGHSYRTDRSGDTFIHAHWFKPVTV